MAISNSPEQPAAPRFALGQMVAYLDHHNRHQVGKVTGIRAAWSYRSGDEPLVVCTVSHPSYAGRRMYVNEKDIKEVTGREVLG